MTALWRFVNAIAATLAFPSINSTAELTNIFISDPLPPEGGMNHHFTS